MACFQDRAVNFLVGRLPNLAKAPTALYALGWIWPHVPARFVP
jgi:hypothetical protein